MKIAAALCTAAVAAGCGGATTVINNPPSTGSSTSGTQSNQTQTVTQTAAIPPANNSPGFTACDQNVSVTASASCPFAENIFYEAWKRWSTSGWGGSSTTLSVYSPVTSQYYNVDCTEDQSSGQVGCTNDSDPSARATFPFGAIRAYTNAEAASYAARANLGPNG